VHRWFVIFPRQLDRDLDWQSKNEGQLESPFREL
jgi:hypothetical protein